MKVEDAKRVCKIGQGNECCAYLGAGDNGLECFKTNPQLKPIIEKRMMAKTMNAMGDNCPGYDNEQQIFLLE